MYFILILIMTILTYLLFIVDKLIHDDVYKFLFACLCGILLWHLDRYLMKKWKL